MDIVIALLIVGAFAHFIYEGIIAPTLRDRLRHQMFELRDQLRAIQIKEGEQCPREAFDIAHHGINQYVNRIHWLTLSFMFEFDRVHQDPKVRDETKRRQSVVANCEQPEIKRIVKEANQVLGQAIAVNSAPFFAYFVVLLATYALMKYGVTKFSGLLYGKASEVFASPTSSTPSTNHTTLAI